MTVRYGVTIEFTVDSILDGGPSKADVRRFLRAAIEGHKLSVLGMGNTRWGSLRDVGIKYLHEATQADRTLTKGPK